MENGALTWTPRMLKPIFEIPAYLYPYPSFFTAFGENDKEHKLKSPVTPSNQSSSVYPPIAPKPNYIAKSPHEPSPPRQFQKLHLDDGNRIKTGDRLMVSAGGSLESEKKYGNTSESYIDDLDGIDGGICSNELETRILRELIYAFQGIEGVMIKRKLKTRYYQSFKKVSLNAMD